MFISASSPNRGDPNRDALQVSVNWAFFFNIVYEKKERFFRNGEQQLDVYPQTVVFINFHKQWAK